MFFLFDRAAAPAQGPRFQFRPKSFTIPVFPRNLNLAFPFIKKRTIGETSPSDFKRPPACAAMDSKSPDQVLDQAETSWAEQEEQIILLALYWEVW